ncbi:ICE-like protease (caspase) p20 domain protein [Ceratobasidium sp. AG-Ba]|nr:ICE-like protease (caspase) p20 domain protein [Ceratobasidium sp. AG-Ba]
MVLQRLSTSLTRLHLDLQPYLNSLLDHLPGALRAGLTPAVVEAQPPRQKDPLKFIEQAILDGDRFQPNTMRTRPPQAERRALIVAPQYPAHFPEWTPLGCTVEDVVLIYEMLLENGYAASNIRILVDGLEDMEGVQPTRDNILASLEWLVSNARKSDYRYFHFSGHGALFDSRQGEGKQALEVPKKSTFRIGDTELDFTPNNHTQYNRVESIEASGDQMKYYKEAIVASYNIVPRRGNKLEYHVIFDTELNSWFAQLPEGCRLTCTLDCCHSGRMVGCNFKLGGAGFRSQKYFTFDQDGRVGERSLGSAQNSELAENLGDLALEIFQHSTLSTPLKKSLISRARSTSSVIAGLIPKVVNATPMKEALPPEEIVMDQIKADMLVWSACHQRQLAMDYVGGIFTREFTSIANASRGAKKTVGDFHSELNLAVKNAASAHKKERFLQYAQVSYTAFCYEDPTHKRSQHGLSLRGAGNQPVHQADDLPHNWADIERAVDEGNRLEFGDDPSKSMYTDRRALIIAIQYQVHFNEYPPLPATLQDVVHVHSMLVASGYQRSNIRVLVDGFDDADQPNRENILRSLKWLVSNTRSDDYRYFHFSGHGVCLDSKKGEGKETREIPQSAAGIEKGDSELDGNSAKSKQYTQVSSISVHEDKIKYYNEAIVTSYKSKRLRQGESPFENNIIRDNVLNKYFAELPDGCKLTCTFDWKADNNFKLVGAGFRGKTQKAAEEGTTFPKANSRPLDGQDHDGGQFYESENTFNFQSPAKSNGNDTHEELAVTGATKPNPTSEPSFAIKTLASINNVSDMIRNWVSPPLVNLPNILPAEEAMRDKIKADVHGVLATNDRKRWIMTTRKGVFTRAFTNVIKEVGDANKTVAQVYDMVK